MIHSLNSKVINLINPSSVATNATASGTVNCVGWRYAEVLLHLATQTAANVDTLVEITEGDGTSFATHADLALTTVAPSTSAPQLYKWWIDLRKRKKNLRIRYTPSGTARIASAVVNLLRPEAIPDTPAERGVTAMVNV